MINLIVCNHLGEKKYSYDCDKLQIIIGSEGADICLQSLQKVHFEIKNEGHQLTRDKYVVYNRANDPFASLNGIPFGKKTLNDKDELQLDGATIRFEMVELDIQSNENQTQSPIQTDQQTENKQTESIDIEALMQQVFEMTPLTTSIKNQTLDVQSLETNSSSKFDSRSKQESENSKDIPKVEILKVNKITNSNSRLNNEQHLQKNQSNIEQHSQENQSKIEQHSQENQSYIDPQALKNTKVHVLDEFDDQLEIPGNEARDSGQIKLSMIDETSKTLDGTSWRLVVGVLVIGVMLSTVILSGVYFRASGKNSQEEKKIAAGLADIMMALTYAKINHIAPTKQNWVDPEFIHSNLAHVLSPNLHIQAQVNQQGQFEEYPYILRVYTSRDTSRFIVIAQPAPNLLQWMIHKKSIIVDSSTMEMRKVSDLKPLNRLLANNNPLEGKNGQEISRVIREGVLMPLDSLAGNKNVWGFTPPKALAYIRPGAENYIYNAPRYYPFHELVLEKAGELIDNQSTSQNVAELQNIVGEISHFRDMVLYTTKGISGAVDLQKAIATYVPKAQFLIGHVNLTPQGYVANSQLMMSDEITDVAYLDPQQQPLQLQQSPKLFSDDGTDVKIDYSRERREEWFSTAKINLNHPLYLRLKNLLTTRAVVLRPIADEISLLLQNQSSRVLSDFSEQFEKLTKDYLDADLEQQAIIIETIQELYTEYNELSLEDFLQIVRAAHLSGLVDIALQSKEEVSEDDIEEAFGKIKWTDNFSDLDAVSTRVSEMLNLEHFSDSEKLMVYQERLRNDLLDKIERLMFVKYSPYSFKAVSEGDAVSFSRILKNAHVVDPDEEKYLLAEFGRLKGTVE